MMNHLLFNIFIVFILQAAPVKREVRNSSDSDGSVLLTNEKEETEEIKVLVDEIFENCSIGIFYIFQLKYMIQLFTLKLNLQNLLQI